MWKRFYDLLIRAQKLVDKGKLAYITSEDGKQILLTTKVLCLVMSANGPLAARPKTRPNWPEQASGAASGQGSCVGRNPPLYGPRGGC